jgi:hypothetical protein
MDLLQRAAARRRRSTAGLVLLVTLMAAGCGGDDSDEAASPTVAPVTTAASGSTAGSASSGLPCDSAVFLQILRDQGGRFDVSPAVLEVVQPSGPPRCQGPFATQMFTGEGEGAAPFPALFGPTPDQSGWALVSVNCNLAEPAGDRRAC